MKAPDGSPPPGEKINVLFVDDEPDLRRGLEIVLGHYYGFGIVCVASVEEARHEIETLVPDVLLLDISIPEESGLVLFQEVKDRKLPIRVVIATAYDAGTPAYKQADAMNPYRILVKPLAMPHLLGALIPPEPKI